jgi:hypothetical protein
VPTFVWKLDRLARSFRLKPFAGREYRLPPVAVRADGGKQRGSGKRPHLSRSESICEAIGTMTPSFRFSTRPATVAGMMWSGSTSHARAMIATGERCAVIAMDAHLKRCNPPQYESCLPLENKLQPEAPTSPSVAQAENRSDDQ